MFKGADGTIFTIQPLVKYLRGALKDKCLRLGYSIAELKMLIEYARTYQERFDQYYEKDNSYNAGSCRICLDSR